MKLFNLNEFMLSLWRSRLANYRGPDWVSLRQISNGLQEQTVVLTHLELAYTEHIDCTAPKPLLLPRSGLRLHDKWNITQCAESWRIPFWRT